MISISIHPDGSVVAHGAEGLPFNHVSRRRATWIEPAWLPLRMAFKALRWLGDESWAAAWTRTWPCRWRANLTPSGGPIVGPFINRAQALEYENQWLLTTELRTWT